MIGRLRGILIEKQPPYLLLDVAGVGYELQAPMTTFYRLPSVGDEVILHTHLSISENLHQLFGFAAERDRTLFRTLIKVNGIGPKSAIAIMSGMEADDLARAIQDNNIKALTKIPGIGTKTAERLVIELRDRIKTWDLNASVSDANPSATTAPHSLSPAMDAYAEAESALVALGYKPVEAAKMIATVMKTKPDANRDELIRAALKSMAN